MSKNDIITLTMYCEEGEDDGRVGGGGLLILSLNIYIVFHQRSNGMGFKDFSSPDSK